MILLVEARSKTSVPLSVGVLVVIVIVVLMAVVPLTVIVLILNGLPAMLPVPLNVILPYPELLIIPRFVKFHRPTRSAHQTHSTYRQD